MFIHFDRIHERDRQTDGQIRAAKTYTDGLLKTSG